MEIQNINYKSDNRFKHFTFYRGFDSLAEAKEALQEIGFETYEGFVFIKITYHSKTYIYPILMENLSLQIIITKEKCWYRNRIPQSPYYNYHYYKEREKKLDKKHGIIKLFKKYEDYEAFVKTCNEIFIGKIIDYDSLDMNEYELIGETISGIEPRISSQWNDEYKNALEKKCDVECIYIGSDIKKPLYLVFDSIILLSTLFYGKIGKY